MLPDDSARIRNISVEVLSDDWYVLRKARFEFLRRDGSWHPQEREAYDRGNGAVILLHDPDRATVLLTRQFRWPAYANDHPDGMIWSPLSLALSFTVRRTIERTHSR